MVVLSWASLQHQYLAWSPVRYTIPDSKVHGANMTQVVCPMNFAIWDTTVVIEQMRESVWYAIFESTHYSTASVRLRHISLHESGSLT